LLKIPKNVFGCSKVVAKAQCQNKEMCNWTSYPIGLYAVAGLLLVVGGVVVQSDETDRYWSEALFALTCCSSNQ
jgi:hypothetical protein